LGAEGELKMSNFDESGGQDVQDESAHEFHYVDGGGLAVFGAKADVVAIKAQQALIRHPDSVGVPADDLPWE
jgi:hypothetical protein